MMINIYKSNGKTFHKLKLSENGLDNGKYKMFSYNKLKCFVDFEKMYIEDEMYLIYKTEEYIKLKDYILQDKLLFKDILIKLKDALNELENYFLLKRENIVLDINYIFIDPFKKQLKLLYVPKGNIIKESFEFNGLINSLIKLYEKDKYYSNIINKTKRILSNNKKVDLNHLEKLISSSKNKVKKEKIKNKEENPKKNIIKKNDEKEIKNVNQDDNKEINKINLVIRTICIIIISFLIYKLLNDVFILKNIFLKLTVAFFIGLGSLISLYYLGFNKILNKDIGKKIEKEIFKQEKNKPLDSKKILGSKTFLIYNNKKIIIDQDQFVIGRDFNKSDFQINDPSVSLLNTEILKQDDEFFIRDLNSTNGTILNNRKLESNKLNKLYSKDVFKVSNHKFKYINEN